MEKILTVLSFIAFFLTAITGPLFAGSKQDLAEIKRMAQEKEAQMRIYKEQESRLSREVRNLSLKERQVEIMRVKLAGDIDVVKTMHNKTTEERDIMEESRPMWEKFTQRGLSNFVIETLLKTKYWDSSEITEQLVTRASLKTNVMFLQKLDSEVNKNQNKLAGFQEKSAKLLAKKNDIENQKQTIKSNYQKTKADLDETHRLYEEALSDLQELNASAEQLGKLLKTAEDMRRQNEQKAGQPVKGPEIKAGEHSIIWPIQGKIISRFGKEYQAQLKTWIFRDGIKIAARYKSSVSAVEDGKVIFAGGFRSYGNVVIIDHNGGFFTIYGFLNDILVNVNDPVQKGQIVGLSGKDTQGAGMGNGTNAVYFEIRVGTKASDPELWLK